jgi:hypothetical protein
MLNDRIISDYSSLKYFETDTPGLIEGKVLEIAWGH